MVEWCLGNLEDGFFDIKFICLHFWKRLLSGSSFFPFMDRGNLDSNSNFNLLPDTGYYSMQRCETSPNGPGFEWGVLVNIKTKAGYRLQIAANNNKMIKIRLGDASFRDWQTISLT